jgi:hypothetical protein
MARSLPNPQTAMMEFMAPTSREVPRGLDRGPECTPDCFALDVRILLLRPRRPVVVPEPHVTIVDTHEGRRMGLDEW